MPVAAAFPPVILGTNVFGWSLDAAASETILDGAVSRGLTAIDTADIYSYWASGNQGGESETIIGNWMASRNNRAQLSIHTKGGAPGAPGAFANANATAAYIGKAVEASLRRLRTDYIDLYYVHFDDKVTPLDETLTLFDKLIKAGKLRAIGASNYTPDRLTTAMETASARKLAPYSVLQTHYNLVERTDFEKNLRPVCDRHGLHVMAYFALAKGFLSGKYRSRADASKSAARGSGATAYLDARGLRVLAALDEIAATRKVNSAAVALAWLTAKPRVHAIASATSTAQLDDLAAAAALKLTAGEVAALDKASA